MRYHLEPDIRIKSMYSTRYTCRHPLYNQGTLFRKGNRGFVTIKLTFLEKNKYFKWGPIEPGLADMIYRNERFDEFFEKNAKEPDENGLYPTIEIKKLLWALRMKPLKKEIWEDGNYKLIFP